MVRAFLWQQQCRPPGLEFRSAGMLHFPIRNFLSPSSHSQFSVCKAFNSLRAWCVPVKQKAERASLLGTAPWIQGLLLKSKSLVCSAYHLGWFLWQQLNGLSACSSSCYSLWSTDETDRVRFWLVPVGNASPHWPKSKGTWRDCKSLCSAGFYMI